MMQRIDKILCDMGIASRSEIKKLVRAGLVKVDGAIIKDPSLKCDENTLITVNNEEVRYIEYEYIMLNKPAGYLSANEDKRDRTVFDIVKTRRKDLFCVGRLDKDTEGLLILTNDGNLSHRLLSPRSHVKKTYYLEAYGILDDNDIKRIAEGIEYGEEKYLPSVLEVLSTDEKALTSKAFLTIYEGKFHQVKNMIAALGKKVTYLKRVSMGNLKLDESLAIGEYRNLTLEELEILKDEN